MKWLLILTMGYSGEPGSTVPVGRIINEDTCKVAGEGMARLLEEANPGLTVTWTCLPADIEAAA